ncbi:hydroxyacylglutathione hydrolase [Thiorhodovibrio frisius]|uniref:Hydroxyacylglutathione hydrolase n=1 Tax=Thiorhodovibrio frisius TaxID=631362 RepID=H8Z5H9_9GAMM|nr:hydroxyacylglutathione hydrolase [Thiorhodovibrio frisius]EIC20549.1 hydroxyacylglutathione hydrolase [Thiorhodovibrio frisius]WPL21297.1 Hydroxyacylglutathione hydrolase [Thiorhodovibrio frisius]
MRIEPIPAFADNYIWLLRQPQDPRVAVVDPGDAQPVLDYLAAQHLELTAILITHHHRDHIGGVAALQSAWPRAEVIAPEDPRIPGATHSVGDGERFRLEGLEIDLQVLAVPGHTSSHIAYLTAEADHPALFCGDTLFSVGCGRVFDGTVEQLAVSLRRIAALAPETRCYCAHEYTLENIGFARWVEPENPALAERALEAERLRAAQKPTVPTILASELATNPFLRVDQPEVMVAAERAAGHKLNGPTEIFAALRRWKDDDYD